MGNYIFNRIKTKEHKGERAKKGNVFLVVKKFGPTGHYSNFAEFKKDGLTEEISELLYIKLYEELLKQFPDMEGKPKD